MDIDKIKEVVNADYLNNQQKENLLVWILAEDPKAISSVLKILECERESTKTLLQDTNAELSTALGVLQGLEEYSWLVERIKQHYILRQNQIKCCIKVDGLP